MVVDKKKIKHKVVIKESIPSDEELLLENAGDVGLNWREVLKELFK